MILRQTHINGKQPVGAKKTGLNTNKKYENQTACDRLECLVAGYLCYRNKCDEKRRSHENCVMEC